MRSLARPFLTYAMIMFLVGSIFSMAFSLRSAFASHSDIGKVDVDDTTPNPGDSITISGIIDNADDNENVDITVREPGGGTDDANTDIDGNDGEYSVNYEIPTSADDGIYEIKVEFGSEDPTYGYFLIDEDNDDAPTETDESSYSQGDGVRITGEVLDPQTAIDEVDIKVYDPTHDEIGPRNSNLDSNDEFDETLDLDSNAEPGLYAVIVEYDGDEAGWAIFEVLEDSGSSNQDPVTVNLSKSSYKPGDEVIISGIIDQVDPSVEAFVTVLDPGDVEIFDDHEDPANSGNYQFEFTLQDDAETGIYTVTVEYNGDEAEKTFVISTSTSGGSTSGSGSNAGLTAKLSDTSLLAGEILTVTGVVPRVIADQPVNIVVLAPDGQFVGVSSYPDPESDKSYSATLRLPGTLEVDEDYSVVISYDSKDIKILFDITGTASGSTGGPVTVETDKTSYGVGSTVRITGDIAEDTFREGEVIALQVYNPDKDLYRVDPITPDSDGSYDYSMVVGGPKGVTGKWQVKVTYAGQVAETSFDLTGGVASKPRYDLKVEGATYSIEYQSDGNVKSMYVRPLEKKLVVSIDGEQEGTLTITLPREVIDAIQGGSDVKYLVSTLDTETGDQKQVDMTESLTTGVSRTLVIDYDAGTDLIEIQGTTVVPEFGPLSAIVLAIAVLSIIAVTARFSNRINSLRFW